MRMPVDSRVHSNVFAFESRQGVRVIHHPDLPAGIVNDNHFLWFPCRVDVFPAADTFSYAIFTSRFYVISAASRIAYPS